MATKEIELIGDLEHDAYVGYAHMESLDLADFEDWKADAEDAFAGQYSSDAEFAAEWVDGTGLLNDAPLLRDYFDYDKYARDLMYDFYCVGDGYYFHNC